MESYMFPKAGGSKTWKGKSVGLVLAVFAIATLTASAVGQKDDDAKRDKIRKMSADTLSELYRLHPGSQKAIQDSAGYAVFDNRSLKLLLAGTARGGGVAVASETNKETFMRMFSAGAGLGAGIKSYRVVFVFETREAFDRFLESGWDAEGHADAAAKTGSKGGAFAGAASLAQGVWVYQITKKGLALQLTLQGTKYYKDDDLNNGL
jgi:lipid-binding SYLF domain-containing protein